MTSNGTSTSATEIELLNELPPLFAAGTTVTSENDKQKQSNNYNLLSMNRGPPMANVTYQDDRDQQLNHAVDKLLNRYAPDAAPHKVLHTTANRRPPTQANVPTEHNEPFVSTFQTNIPPTTSHGYSSVIRPNNTQFAQSQPQANPSTNNRNTQAPGQSRPTNHYDNIQHNVQQSKTAMPIKTKDGFITQVVPGKLYTLEDDPLHLLYDRQEPASSTHQPSFQSTFQPSMNAQNIQDPLSSHIYPNGSQRYPHQSAATTTTNTVPNDRLQPFDLGNLIKRVQEEYLREIQPFVSSVKFVEKDREFGQNLNDVGFSTPVTVRKGFTRQADDILRNSFGGRRHHRKPGNQYDSKEYSDDDVDELRSSGPYIPLQKFDSKQSFTSVTSTSSYDDDYDERGLPIVQPKKKVTVHDQGTSPPPRPTQASMRATESQPYNGSAGIPSTSVPTNQFNGNSGAGTTTDRSGGVKLAQRISSGQYTRSSSGSDSEDDYTATYYDPEPPRKSQGINAVVATEPLAPPTASSRERGATNNQVPQRSEDIRPTPPTIRPGANSQNAGRHSESEGSGSEISGSDQVSDSDDDKKPSVPTNQATPTTTSRSNVPQNASTTPGGRSAAAPQSNSRDTVAANQPVTSRNPAESNARGAPPATTTTTARTTVENNSRGAPPATATTTARTTVENNSRGAPPATTNPTTTARTTVENNARAAGAAGSTNLHFVPPDQRSAAASGGDRGAQAAPIQPNAPSTTAAAQTGSTRLFHGDNDQKGKRSLLDSTSVVGNKIKSLFRKK
ncbi:unnamed protein product [Adineta ricciae]|uniref:Uncharacterized protein n=1 Tax=Adineta ricciae TaxID=249248 RepID=A0A815FWJ8_ADIRI|nr:unnamed protein product [Adineta ricciae]